MSSKRGPRQKTIKNKNGSLVIRVGASGMNLEINPKNRLAQDMDISDSSVREIRDWMNWYLDRK